MTTKQELFKMAVMDQKDDVQNEDLDTVHRCIEDATKKIYHTTQADRQKEARKPPDNFAVSGERTNREEGAYETGEESQGRAHSKMQSDAWQKNIEKKASDRTTREQHFHRRQRRLKRKNYRGTVKRSMSIPRRQLK